MRRRGGLLGVAPAERVVGRGGVPATRPLPTRASSKVLVDEPRRVVRVEYADGPDLGDGLRPAVV